VVVHSTSRQRVAVKKIVRLHDSHGRSLRDVTWLSDTSRRDIGPCHRSPRAGADFRAESSRRAVDHTPMSAA